MDKMFSDKNTDNMSNNIVSNTSLSRLQQFYSDLEAEALIRVMNEEFKGKIALFSSFGAYSALLIDMAMKVDNEIPVLFLDTGKHFKETIEYVERIKQQLGVKNLRILRPDEKILENSDPNGDLWKSNVDRCCWVRKVEPLDRELEAGGYEAIITGRRQYQTKDRKGLQKIELDEHDRFRINPLGFWNKDKIIAEFAERELEQHPLVAEGYPSIGCKPCTSMVKEGDDPRAGRWKHAIDLEGKQKTECGIHLNPSETTDWSI